MNFTATIDNVTSIEWGFSVQQAYAFAWVYQLSSWAFSSPLDGEIYYHAERSKFIEDMPLLTNREDTVYRTLKEFVELGLIKMRKIGRKDFVCLTEKGKKWNRTKSEKNPSLDESRKKIRPNSENFPNDTIYNHNTNDPITELENKSQSQIPHSETPPSSATPPLTEGQKFTEWVIKKIAPVPVRENTIPKIAPMYDKLIRAGYTKEDIAMAVEFGVSDEFWRQQFLSPLKLDSVDKNKEKYIDIFIAKAKLKRGTVASPKPYNPRG